jgi:hypothetical protein
MDRIKGNDAAILGPARMQITPVLRENLIHLAGVDV